MLDQRWLTTPVGVRMPPIIYGTAWKKERTADLVVKAVQAGFRGIDTACQPKHYDEPLVGEALLTLRDKGVEREALFLQTKFTPLPGHDPDRIPYDKNSSIESQIAQSFEVSKHNLHTDYIDSLVLHSTMAPYSRLIKAWKAMEEIQLTGGARQLGISNCYEPDVLMRLYEDVNVKPAVVQNRFYKDTEYDADMRRWCFDHGVIYQSFWTLTANRHLLASRTVQTIATKYNKTEAQVFFRYVSQCGIVPLTGTSSEQHMREDLDIFDFELSSDELKRVNHLLIQA